MLAQHATTATLYTGYSCPLTHSAFIAEISFLHAGGVLRLWSIRAVQACTTSDLSAVGAFGNFRTWQGRPDSEHVGGDVLMRGRGVVFV